MGDFSLEPEVKKKQLSLEISFSFFCYLSYFINYISYMKKHILNTGYMKLNFINIGKNNVLLAGLWLDHCHVEQETCRNVPTMPLIATAVITPFCLTSASKQ